uniref:Ig-like domain-containing protein n=1 Tax=Oncorhynchus tshawytscha TaxID=74940 RepID=A0A8C8MM52_ONCTS
MVTVSSAATAPPTLLTLMNCGTPSNNTYSLGCIAKGFSPSSLTFKWTDASGKALTDFVQYPAVQSGKTYTGVSQVRVSKNDWENSKSFNCSVDHAGGAKTAVINKPVSKLPTVSLLSAPIGTTQYLICMIEDFTPNKVTVTWKKNDMEVEGQTPTVGQQPSGLYSAAFTLLKVTNTDWNNKVEYSCVVGTDQDTVSGTTITWHVNGYKQTAHIDLKPIESKGNMNSRVSTLTIDQTRWTNVNKVQCSAMKRGEVTPVIQDLSFNKGSRSLKHLNVVVISGHMLQVLEREAQDVQTFAPAQHTREKEIVTLVCLVVSPSLCDVYIIWNVNSGDYQEGVTSPPQKTQKGNYSVTSVFTTTKKEWEGNSVFTCAVKHLGSDNNTTPQERSKIYWSIVNIKQNEDNCFLA